ncbi:uncharacterized protein LOC112509172 [Cynara cardunculus var. scolymus]|uniref:Uncharacterized protein n=1 Tax=Cynara cardunculus var. scolymus TaxID=59895 RepID=A0A103YFG2_CYNCS|nr:uncharacterized protein LOC112509172 [Cynara cardunculus var. scolymus]KVI08127.1 hypothetical protein Ccrd_013504 [Cynara cardunculus var. scolymus]
MRFYLKKGIARPRCSYQYDTSYQASFVRPPAAMPTVEIVLCVCRHVQTSMIPRMLQLVLLLVTICFTPFFSCLSRVSCFITALVINHYIVSQSTSCYYFI